MIVYIQSLEAHYLLHLSVMELLVGFALFPLSGALKVRQKPSLNVSDKV